MSSLQNHPNTSHRKHFTNGGQKNTTPQDSNGPGYGNQLILKCDQFIFENINNFKTHPSYQKILNSLSIIPRQQRSLMNHAVTGLLILAPVIFLGFLFNTNFKIRKNNEMKLEILDMAKTINQHNEQMNQLKQSVFISPPLKSQEDFDGLVKQSVGRMMGSVQGSTPVNLSNVISSQFTLETPLQGLLFSQGQIEYSKFSTGQLMDFITQLLNSKFKVSKLMITKDPIENTLKGQIFINGLSEEVSFAETFE
jgi:hypothetical protein